MDALDTVATVPTIGLSLAIAIATLMTRRAVEFALPSLSKKTAPTREQQFWEKLALPMLPILLCVLFCSLVSPSYFDYPAVALKSTVSRIVYSVLVGWFSTWTYSIVTFLIMKKWNVSSSLAGPSPVETSKDIAMSSDPPPPNSPPVE